MCNKKKIGILISGRGSNMVSIAQACKEGSINGEIVVVISNKKSAAGLEKANELGIETVVHSHKKYPSRQDYDLKLIEELRKRNVDLVCLAGFMRLLSEEMIRAFPMRIMNIHPSLLPSFPGLDAQLQAADYGVKISGATVHFVDEKLDHGPIILQSAVPVESSDDGEKLAARILEIEHKIYPEAVKLYCSDRLAVEGRKVIIH